MNEAALQAEMMKGFQQEQPQPPQGGQPPVDASGVGGATIGTGGVPAPGQQGFTGNEQQPTQQPQAAGGQPAGVGPIQ
jgi:hypothetical protein